MRSSYRSLVLVWLTVALVGISMVGCAARSPEVQEALAAPEPVRIQPGNLLRIKVWPDSSLGGEFPVEETGNVYLPLIGAVPVGGQPLPAIRADLRRLYDEAIRSAIVTVTPVYNVSVLGAVQRPGLYPVTPTTQLFDVISVAGGFAANAKQNGVRVLRNGRVLEINAERAIETGEAELALALRPGDRVIVPVRSRFLNLGTALNLVQSALVIVALWNQIEGD